MRFARDHRGRNGGDLVSAFQQHLFAPSRPAGDGSLQSHELIVDLFAGGGGASTSVCPPVAAAIVRANVCARVSAMAS